jgi:shikimate dehydrogenase
VIPDRPTNQRLFVLLGGRVAHSLSPAMQNAALEAASLPGTYTALGCDAEHLPGHLRGIAHAGGGGNVTVPHKALAAVTVDRRTATVERTGACNTFWAEGGHVWGDNTDVEGFRRAARELLGQSACGATVLLLGAGGAARAVVAALQDDEAERVVVANRSVERAEALVRDMAGAGTRLDAVQLPDQSETFDLIVNATTLGMDHGDPLPISIDRAPRFGAALDLVCTPGRTPWINQISARGLPAADGLEMLIHQGAASFRRWWGIEPSIAAMRDAVGSPN